MSCVFAHSADGEATQPLTRHQMPISLLVPQDSETSPFKEDPRNCRNGGFLSLCMAGSLDPLSLFFYTALCVRVFVRT